MANLVTEILRAASKHPNSRVSKLIHTVEEEPSQKNIVLLLIELAEHAEYSIDFDVSLKYYLDLFERLGINHDLVLNEAGLLLVNSSKIYSKRVDYVQSLVERQILTLSNADDELQKQKLEQQQTEDAAPVEKPKRGRKRVLEAPSDPYEVELVPKKFKKLTEDKRFALSKTVLKTKPVSRNIEMEQHIHPAGWQYATIYDLENDEDVDTKRNYKLFTYHVEHRYNTLVPDINFRLHFKVKDYIDEQEEMEETEACNTNRIWPPLSEAYVQKYINLENYVLQQDIKATKRKGKDEGEGKLNLVENPKNFLMMNNEPADALQTNLNISNINESIGRKDHSELEQSLLETSETNILPKLESNLESSNSNGKNDSGLGQSVLDDTNSTLENTQLNCTLETSTALENSNDLTATQANKSLNATKSKTENDSALGTSILDHSANTDNNTSLEEIFKNPKTTTNEENINDSSQIEANTSLNGTKRQAENCSSLDNSVLDQTSSTANNTTTEESRNLETTQENSEIYDTTINQEEEIKQSDVEDLTKDTENKNNTALIPPENLVISKENPNVVDEESGKIIEIDLAQQQDKDTTQIRVHLPHGDDEGVYLSDLEEHDCGLLSPVNKASNILSGVERKDITILMDDELRQALEMRDGIMEHFGYEIYKVPVITETIKQKLIFNILKLPEKLIRRKVLFKLGPDMDLYLQARSFKRCKPETVARVIRSTQLMQWFSLNNTDMSGVSITPPNSPGHTSIFCGFTDDEDDTISCVDFRGFTEVEQSAIMSKDISRLSRDSGVGVDANNVVQETLEKVIGKKQTSKEDDGDINNLDKSQTTESILNQLPAEIRDVLRTELEDDNQNNITTDTRNNKAIVTKKEVKEAVTTLNNTDESENLGSQINEENTESVQTQNCYDNNTEEFSKKASSSESFKNSEETEIMCTESSVENSKSLNTEKSFPNNTPKSDELAEGSSETQTCTEQISIENSEINECKSKPSDLEVDIENSNNSKDFKKSDGDLKSSDEPTTAIQSDKNQEDLVKEGKDCENTTEEKLTFLDCQDFIEANSCDDDVMLDLSTQGNKTKIQQWHEHLQPILAKSRERHHFDVYKLGTEILDTVQSRRKSNNENFKSTSTSTSSDHVASFHDIMDNKDKSYVSRYFLSTLLLANQNNIEISLNNKSSEKPSSWHDIHLKLLSTKRHTVAIEDNIGMIDNKQNARDKTCKQNTKEIKRKATNNYQNGNESEEEDEPLIKLQNISKTTNELNLALKRSSDNATTSCIAEKKLKEITFPTDSRHNKLPNLIQSIEIIRPPFKTVPSSINTLILPSTSRQVPFDVNINAIRTLQPIEKNLDNVKILKFFRKIKHLPSVSNT